MLSWDVACCSSLQTKRAKTTNKISYVQNHMCLYFVRKGKLDLPVTVEWHVHTKPSHTG
jgi:hypothetical protein